jgi:hypothetical protein
MALHAAMQWHAQYDSYITMCGISLQIWLKIAETQDSVFYISLTSSASPQCFILVSMLTSCRDIIFTVTDVYACVSKQRLQQRIIHAQVTDNFTRQGTLLRLEVVVCRTLLWIPVHRML